MGKPEPGWVVGRTGAGTIMQSGVGSGNVRSTNLGSGRYWYGKAGNNGSLVGTMVI